ncbi:hypothetical protein L3V64_003245 [Geobacillus stearothermophilus]|uniref:hypothetical protein n=1 Tax=Geobacillus stearothermophilus TaxID=1422 RepID=UPI001F435651|nr:hypothetical protein [Geobacillus stearothermophilus]MCK7605389.1 hypothetical protein [Geobacillus stearothermophilus]
MGYPLWIRLEYRNGVGSVTGLTASVCSEADFLNILEHCGITRTNLLAVRINDKDYPISRLDALFAKLQTEGRGSL